VGSTTRLVLDEAKLTDALNQNPQAVEALFSTFTATLGTVSGTGNNITAVSGTPLNQHVDGTYYVKVLDSTGKAEARLVGKDGRTIFTNSGTLVPGQDNTLLIPGVKISVGGTLTVGEDNFALNVTGRGVGIQLKDNLDSLLGTDGFFQSRADSSQTVTDSLNKQLDAMNTRLTAKEAQLKAKFAALETAMAKLQSQGNSLAAAIARLGS
jgi:flagellar capping protein FliD